MPKSAQTNIEKARYWVTLRPSEFLLNPKNELWCKKCLCVVNCSRRFFVNSHINTSKHIKSQNSTQSQTLINSSKQNFNTMVVNAFTSANIPLKKVTNLSLKKLFLSMGYTLPSETTCRELIPNIASSAKYNVKTKLENQEIFLMIDEGDFNGKKFLNILVGSLKIPSVSYLLECIPLISTVNSQVIVQAIDDAIRYLQTPRPNFCLLLTDAAPYNMKAASTLHQMYPRLFHITCIAHLLHNCALRIKAYYRNVNNLIASLKLATLKNKARSKMFSEIGTPPDTIVTRWGS